MAKNVERSADGGNGDETIAERWERWEATSPAFAARRERIDAAQAALAELSRDELVDVLLAELDRARLDEDGNQTDAPGLYNAAAEAVLALMGEPNDGEMAERLAAVGRGVQVRSLVHDDAPLIRELAATVESVHVSQNVAHEDKAPMLAKTLEKRHGRAVNVDEIAAALTKPSASGRATAAALALGMLSGGHKEASARVRRALRLP